MIHTVDVKLKSGICALWPEMQGAEYGREHKHLNYHSYTNKQMHVRTQFKKKKETERERKRETHTDRCEAEQEGLECVAECREDIEMTWV